MLYEQNGIVKALVPTPCASVQARVVDVAMSPYHTAVLTETGTLVTFGRNSDGQLGRGHSRPTTAPGSVKGMSDKVVTVLHTIRTSKSQCIPFQGDSLAHLPFS